MEIHELATGGFLGYSVVKVKGVLARGAYHK